MIRNIEDERTASVDIDWWRTEIPDGALALERARPFRLTRSV